MWEVIGVMGIAVLVGIATWQLCKIYEDFGKYEGEKAGVKEYRQHFRITRFRSLRQQIEDITGKMSSDTWYDICRTATMNIKANRIWTGQRTYLDEVIDTLHKSRNLQKSIIRR